MLNKFKDMENRVLNGEPEGKETKSIPKLISKLIPKNFALIRLGAWVT